MFDLTISSPEKIVYQGKAEILNVYTVNGQVGILKNHAPFVDIVIASELNFVDEKGERKKLVVSGGWILVWPKEVTVFVNSSEYTFAIDVDRAKLDKEKAERELASANKDDVVEIARAKAKIEKATVRIMAGIKEGNK